MKPWTKKHLECIKTNVHFEQSTLEATLEHYLHEVEHIAERILKLEKAIDDAVKQSPPQIRAVIEACRLYAEWRKPPRLPLCLSLARFPDLKVHGS